MIQYSNTAKMETPFLVEMDSNPTSPQGKLIVPSLNGYDILNWNDIIYLHAQGNYTHIVCINQKKYCFSKVLKYVSNKIDSDLFLKCHRSYIINTDHLKSICFTKLGYHCLMTNEKIIPVSRANKSVVKEWIEERM